MFRWFYFSLSFLCRACHILSVFTARCTIVQSTVLRSHVVCPSVCLSVCDVESRSSGTQKSSPEGCSTSQQPQRLALWQLLSRLQLQNWTSRSSTNSTMTSDPSFSTAQSVPFRCHVGDRDHIGWKFWKPIFQNTISATPSLCTVSVLLIFQWFIS